MLEGRRGLDVGRVLEGVDGGHKQVGRAVDIELARLRAVEPHEDDPEVGHCDGQEVEERLA